MLVAPDIRGDKHKIEVFSASSDSETSRYASGMWTLKGLIGLATVSAQVIPVLLLAIIADPAARRESSSKSKYVIAAIGIGMFGETQAFLSIASDTSELPGDIPAISYVIAVSIGAAVLALMALLLAPHLMVHLATIRSTDADGRWLLILGWCAFALLVVGSINQLIVGESDFNTASAYVTLALSLVLLGIMTTVTIATKRARSAIPPRAQQRQPALEDAESDRAGQ